MKIWFRRFINFIKLITPFIKHSIQQYKETRAELLKVKDFLKKK